jgi:hypothetical protein
MEKQNTPYTQMEYYSATKKNEVLIFPTWINLDMILNEGQIQESMPV